MAFANFDSSRTAAPMAEINMVPLIDVMLVLLVIFIITAPLLNHAVKLVLPKASAERLVGTQHPLNVFIDAQGQRYLESKAMSREALAEQFVQAGKAVQTPEVLLRVDQSVPYRLVAETLADASQSGLHKVGFVTDAGPARPPLAPAAAASR